MVVPYTGQDRQAYYVEHCMSFLTTLCGLGLIGDDEADCSTFYYNVKIAARMYIYEYM